MTGAVYPNDRRRCPGLAAEIDEHTVLREVELRVPKVRIRGDAIQQRHRPAPAPHFESVQIEENRKQRTLVQIDQVTAWQHAPEVTTAMHDLPLAGVQREDLQICVLVRSRNRVSFEKHCPSTEEN